MISKYLLVFKIKLTVLILLFCSSCSSLLKHNMMLENSETKKSIAMIKFKILDIGGKDITNDCVVQYTTQDKNTPTYKLKSNSPHFLTFSTNFKIEYVSCLNYLLVYKYYFNSFEFKSDEVAIYNFGEYVLQYDYKNDYEKTSFYKNINKDISSGIITDYPKHRVNEGVITLLNKKAIDNKVFISKFPSIDKRKVVIMDFFPKNI